MVVAVDQATIDSSSSSVDTFFGVANSFLHRLVVQLKILPYIDMIEGIINNMDTKDRKFLTSRKIIVASFKATKRMYHFPGPQKIYDNLFIKIFVEKNKLDSNPIRQWRQDPRKNKHGIKDMYSLASIVSLLCYAATMICKLFISPNTKVYS